MIMNLIIQFNNFSRSEVREKHYREHTVLHMSWKDWNNFKLDDETYEYRYKENENGIKENMKKKHESTVD